MSTADIAMIDPHVRTFTMNVEEPQPTGFVLPFQKRMTTAQRSATRATGLPGRSQIPHPIRNHFVTFLGEFVGTFAFLFFAFAGTQVANSLFPDSIGANLLYISLSFGFSLAVNVWVFFRISGGIFNPAVALALALVGAIPWSRMVICYIAEISGAITAAGVVSALLPGDLVVSTALPVGISVTRGLFIEMLLTAELIFTIFMLAAEKHRATFIAPIGIGLALFIAELAGVPYTGGSLNPARSFGPAVAIGYFEGYHWIYWLGPFLGALLATLFYRLMKILEYELANPGADDTASVHETRAGHANTTTRKQRGTEPSFA